MMKSKSFTLDDIKGSKVAGLNQHLFASTEEKEKKKRNKYGNTKVEFDGKIFDSKKELDRYITLRMRLKAGEIKDLQCQVTFRLEADGEKVCDYIADFVYVIVETDLQEVEDVKSSATRKLAVYRLKKKLMAACYGIEIKEV